MRSITRTLWVLTLAVAALLTGALPASAAQYTVRGGDTLGAIAARHGTTVNTLVRANGIPNPNLIRIGQRLTIPSGSSSAAGTSSAASPSASSGGGVHSVQRGDTVSRLASRYGTTVAAIARANGLSNVHVIRVGQRLTIPGGSSSSASTGSAVPAPAPSGGSYVVRRGDTLSAIAVRAGTTVAALASLNGMRASDILSIGRALRLPGSTGASAVGTTTPSSSTSASQYIVRSGDSLFAIARRFGTSVAELARANAISNPAVIRVGQRLTVTGSGSSSAAPSTPAVVATPITASTSGWGSQPSRQTVGALIDASSARYGVDPRLVRAVAWQESGWWQGARSSAGAIGVMQLMPATAKWLGPALLGRSLDPTSARDNIDGGAAYLAWLIRQTGNRNLALASYYQGLSSVRSRGLYDDTRNYVASVNAHYSRF